MPIAASAPTTTGALLDRRAMADGSGDADGLQPLDASGDVAAPAARPAVLNVLHAARTRGSASRQLLWRCNHLESPARDGLGRSLPVAF